jgi:hypothetical protein
MIFFFNPSNSRQRGEEPDFYAKKLYKKTGIPVKVKTIISRLFC